MAKVSQKSSDMTDVLDMMSKRLFNRSRSDCITSDTCVMCGQSATNFRDALSRKEFSISGMCQPCQDHVFGGK